MSKFTLAFHGGAETVTGSKSQAKPEIPRERDKLSVGRWIAAHE